MKKHTLRRRFSFTLPAFIFLSFTFAETVEVRAFAETVRSWSLADESPTRIEPAHRTDPRSV